jgi:plastocyanin
MMIFYALFSAVVIFNTNPSLVSIHTDSISQTRTAEIKGFVSLPAVQAPTGRRFRGSAYRDRGNTNAPKTEQDGVNRFVNTIISAHPLSFEIDDLPTSDSVLINQKDATFFPSVTPVTIGSTVQFVNNDPFFHNVFSLTPGAKFNIGRRPTGDVYSKQVTPPKWKVLGLGPIDLFCDIHSDMNAIILSLDTPYFTRLNEDGSYHLKDLPPGTYEIRIYNRNFELLTRKVTVAASEDYDLNFNLAR